jgi:predicted nuclease of predicted toxin-antitoxin system
MRILFDNGTPRGLARFLAGHSVEEARARGWEELTNGELIEVAEQAGFELIVTTDKNIRYQQNLKARRIALVVLEHSQWPMVKVVAENIGAAVNATEPGDYVRSVSAVQGVSRRVSTLHSGGTDGRKRMKYRR